MRRILAVCLLSLICLVGTGHHHVRADVPADHWATSTGNNGEDGLGRFVFGRDYLRIYVDTLYLPKEKNKLSSLFITVTTKNAKQLTFKFAMESKPNQVYSGRGEYLVVPCVALNTKSPIEVQLEMCTRKDASSIVGTIQGVLGAAATVFTGGALATVSGLTRYADATQVIVQGYETSTQQSDLNRTIVFDASDKATFKENLSSIFAVFSAGKGTFKASMGKWDAPATDFKESCIGDVKLADQIEEQKSRTPYKFVLKDTSPPLSGEEQDTTLYPDGKSAFVVLRFQTYTPYHNLEAYPEQVPGVKDSFKVLTDLSAGHRSDDDPQQLQALLEQEGLKLYSNLQVLTDAGDLSLADAKVVMKACYTRIETALGALVKDGDAPPQSKVLRNIHDAMPDLLQDDSEEPPAEE